MAATSAATISNAVSGNAAAAPPSSAMNSRRFTRSPRRRARVAWVGTSWLLRGGRGQWLPLFDDESRDSFHRRATLVDAFVYFAGFDEEGFPGLVGRGWFAFVVECEDAFLDVHNHRARMSVSALATSDRNFNSRHDGLIARNRQVLRQQYFALNGRLLRYDRNGWRLQKAQQDKLPTSHQWRQVLRNS